jgi:peroxiredoxin
MEKQMIRMILACCVLLLAGGVAHARGIPTTAEQVTPLLVGAQAPNVVFKTSDGSSLDLRKAAAERPLVLIFYRGGWCPYCNLHLGQLQSIESSLETLGYRIVAVSPDKPEQLRVTTEKQTLGYTLVSDSEAAGIKAFGIAFRVDDRTFKRYKDELQIDLEGYSGAKHHLLPVPAVFIIGRDGRVLFQYVNPDFTVRLHPEILLAAAKAHAEKR